MYSDPTSLLILACSYVGSAVHLPLRSSCLHATHPASVAIRVPAALLMLAFVGAAA